MFGYTRRIIAVIQSLAKRHEGSVLVEVALSLPLLLILFTGGFEISRYALLQMKISRVAMTMADIAAQDPDSLTTTEIDGFIAAVPHIGTPFTLDDTNVEIIISSIKADSTSTPKVCWQLQKMASLGVTSSVGAKDATATMPQPITFEEGDTAIVAEVYFDYAPVLFSGIVDARVMSSTAVFRPRLATLEILQPSGITCT